MVKICSSIHKTEKLIVLTAHNKDGKEHYVSPALANV